MNTMIPSAGMHNAIITFKRMTYLSSQSAFKKCFPCAFCDEQMPKAIKCLIPGETMDYQQRDCESHPKTVSLE